MPLLSTWQKPRCRQKVMRLRGTSFLSNYDIKASNIESSVDTPRFAQKSAVPSATGNPLAAGASTHAPGRACWLSGHMHAWDAKPCCACACVWMNMYIYIYIILLYTIYSVYIYIVPNQQQAWARMTSSNACMYRHVMIARACAN